MDMTFVQLQYLLEIHKAGSFSQAAKNLFISQPSISIMLKALEDELGYPIFLRTKKGLVPTAEGAAVIDHAKRICESYRQLTDAAPSKKTTLVRISSASVPPVQKAFVRLVKENKDRRDIRFSLTQERKCIQQVQDFTLEVGFYIVLSSRLLHFQDLVLNRGLQTQVLATFPGAIRISKEHPLFQRETLSPADFENEMFLDTTDCAVSEALLEAGIARIKANHNIVSSQHHVRKDLLLQGLVYDITFFVPNEKDTDFRYIPVDNLNYKLIALTNPLRPMSPEIIRFMQLLQEELHASESLQ